MSYEDKQRLYRAGAYAFPPPPVTGFWSEVEWIAWIDQCGQWLPHLVCIGCGG